MKHWPNLSNGIIRGNLYRRKGWNKSENNTVGADTYRLNPTIHMNCASRAEGQFILEKWKGLANQKPGWKALLASITEEFMIWCTSTANHKFIEGWYKWSITVNVGNNRRIKSWTFGAKQCILNCMTISGPNPVEIKLSENQGKNSNHCW